MDIFKSTPAAGAVEIDLTKAETLGFVVIKEAFEVHGAPFKDSIKVKKEKKHVIPWIYFQIKK